MGLILAILGFIWWWPIGLLILGYMFARGRFGRWREPVYAGEGPMLNRQPCNDRWERKMARMQDKMERIRSRVDSFRSRDGFGAASSGNHAFDAYRADTLKRLEDEQREFKDFLDRLRVAKDRAEFDQFMADRRRGEPEPSAGSPLDNPRR